MVFKISDENFWENINTHCGNGGGVYKVIAIENEKPVTINRLLGSDEEGVLYIGKAVSYLDRVITLKKSTDPTYKSSNHEFGARYKQHPSIKTVFPYDTLHIKLLQSDKPEELEVSELQKYYETFGELPPLNRQEGKTATNMVLPKAGLTISIEQTNNLETINQ